MLVVIPGSVFTVHPPLAVRGGFHLRRHNLAEDSVDLQPRDDQHEKSNDREDDCGLRRHGMGRGDQHEAHSQPPAEHGDEDRNGAHSSNAR